MYIYMALFVLETYTVLIMHETILIRLTEILDYYFLTHSLKSPFIREDWKLIRGEFTN